MMFGAGKSLSSSVNKYLNAKGCGHISLCVSVGGGGMQVSAVHCDSLIIKPNLQIVIAGLECLAKGTPYIRCF